jgi:hypothetical protein
MGNKTREKRILRDWTEFAPETGAHLDPGERGGVPTPRAATAKLTHSLFEAFQKNTAKLLPKAFGQGLHGLYLGTYVSRF